MSSFWMPVLYGISCRNYEAAAEAIPGAIGLSGSTVSRGFIRASDMPGFFGPLITGE